MLPDAKSMMAELRESTRELHERAEAAVALTRPGLGRDGYRRLLARFYGIYEPLEAELGRRVDLPLDFEGRRKAHLIAADLGALGLSRTEVDALPRCAELPRLRGPHRALGCMYVLEGATLGGKIITRTVCAGLGVAPGSGCSFFASYGDRIGPMWKAFGAAVAAAPGVDAHRREVIAGARDTFATFERWFSGAV